MGFREKILGLLAEDKKDSKEAQEILTALDSTLNKYAADIEALKKEKRAAAGGPSPEEITAMEKELEALRPLKDKVSEYERNLKGLQKEKADLTTQLSEERTRLRDHINDGIMRKSLSSVGVGGINEEDIEDAINFIQKRVVYENDKTFVKVMDEKGVEEKYGLEEYVSKVYPTTNHAKRFIPSGDDTGTGARNGNRGKGQSKLTLEQEYEEAQKSGDVGRMIAVKEQMSKEK